MTYITRIGTVRWLWLAVGILLLGLAAERWDTRIAQTLASTKLTFPIACVAPVFVIHFVRHARPAVALGVALGACLLVELLSSRMVLASPQFGVQMFLVDLYALANTLPYIADRFIGVKHSGVSRTLVFPATLTTVFWLVSLTPFGTWAVTAYAAYGNVAIEQIASFVGLWGLTFVMAWFASIVNALWDARFRVRPVRAELAVFVVVLLVVSSAAIARLRYFAPTKQTVQVAGIVPDRELFARLGAAVDSSNLRPGTAATRQRISTATQPTLDDLLDRSRLEARAGAKIIAWSEVAAFTLQEDEATTLARAKSLAREERIYLQIGIGVFLHTDHFPFFENRAILIDPAGEVLWDYAKSQPVPFNESGMIAAGLGVVPVVDTPYGRLSTVICWDADFPALVRQVGRARADILIVPSWDHRRYTYYHAKLSSFRAVENGVALVRPTLEGLSLAVDHQGRLLGLVDDLSINPATLVVDVPTRGAPTVYARTGDLFGYLSLATLVLLSMIALGKAEPLIPASAA